MNTARPSDSSSPGMTLRQAREQRRLSIDEVARSLNLAPQRIEALEKDAYEKLPGPTYVRGYLRSYAQLLGLPVQPLLDSFNQTPVAAQRNELVAPAPPAAAETAGDDVLVKVGMIGIAVVVTGLALLWWSGRPDAEPPAGENGISASAPLEEKVPGYESTPSVTATPPAPASAEPAPKSPTVTASTPAAPTTTPAPTTAPAVDASVPRVSLVLRVREDSWVDVRDAVDNRLLYQTLAAGRVVTVQGVAPLSVFLGNVDGVDVEFNGKAYDALRHKRGEGEVARFTLGTAASR